MRTLRNLPSNIKKEITLLVRPEEYDLYEKYCGEVNVFSLPLEVTDYGKTIHYILSEFAGQKICILDDDLDFAYRPWPNDYHIRPQTPDITNKMFEEIDQALKNLAHVSVSAREGNNRIEKDSVENVRYMRFLCYNLSMFEGIDIEIYKTMMTFTDFDLNLQLLRKGRKSLVFFKYAQGQVSSNSPGGCSVQRTMNVQKECAELLAERHPGFVKVVTKKTKHAWNGQERSDVHVAWKKAFNSSQEALCSQP